MDDVTGIPPNVLLVGTDGKGEVVINHPQLLTDEKGHGYITFSPEQARNLSRLIMEKAINAEQEIADPNLKVRCTKCGSEFTDAQLENVSACPKCGTKGVPSAIDDDVVVRVNWHELRILGIWASFWASKDDFEPDSRAALSAIIARLEKQYPEKTPLTLAGEVRKLQEEMPSIELRQGTKVVVPPKKVQ